MKIKEDLLKWYDYDYCLKAVKQDGQALQYVKNKTEEICFAAVKQNGYALKYVKDQTEEICLAAVRQKLDAIRYVDIKKFPKVLEYYRFNMI